MSTRRILITGGGTGIGKAIAHRFLAETPELVLVGRRAEPLESAAEELRGKAPGARIATRTCDLTVPEQVEELAGQLRTGAPIDVIVANAGGNYGLGAKTLAETAQAWRADFDGNVLSAVLITQALRDHMPRPGGRIIAMSSIAALRGSGAYGAAKAAVNAWVLSLAGELAPEGITVNAVAPGFVPETDFWQGRIAADPGIIADRTAPIPMKRPGTAVEVAEAVAYLAAPDAGWTTGQILQVNGGTLFGRG
ncbi:SDR family NAD(P)-dependent oxidoreductase [Yimella sp. cx-51]|uniref:SDR family NAD(P)-dependent oxidoreductase n=1 Tax=Yimella sp. cx-51 TaxID=2770551 RepID=UPI00165DED32|nr:SDR family oxidoreductase [Yimella sp. cx-51]MBC9957447.1 SDR family oxidoreductase [Yimella sp. cx-51]QTH39316.1 SDR family oxidoreductase [Yimella sp. cx-51]